MRIDRQSATGDSDCSAANPTQTLCQHLVDPVSAARWLVYPAISACCWCCSTASGCGAERPDWIVQVNGSYLGRAPYTSPYRTFPSVDSWLAQGNQVRVVPQAGEGVGGRWGSG